MICHGNKSNAHLGWSSLQKYIFGDVQNIDFFSYSKFFLEHNQSFKNRLFKAGNDWILPTYILWITLAKIKK